MSSRSNSPGRHRIPEIIILFYYSTLEREVPEGCKLQWDSLGRNETGWDGTEHSFVLRWCSCRLQANSNNRILSLCL